MPLPCGWLRPSSGRRCARGLAAELSACSLQRGCLPLLGAQPCALGCSGWCHTPGGGWPGTSLPNLVQPVLTPWPPPSPGDLLPARPQLVKLARDFVELARKAVNTWPEAKPWLDADDIARLVEKVGRGAA